MSLINEAASAIIRVWDTTINGLKTTLASALDEDIDAVTSYPKDCTVTKISADGIVSASPVGLVGYYVSASSSGVITFYDNGSAASGDTMLATSKSVSTNDVVVLARPIKMSNGAYFKLVSGTATVYVLTLKTAAA